MILRVLVLVLAASCPLLRAAPGDYEGKPIRSFEFVPDDQPLSRNGIMRSLALREGAPFSSRELSNALERLYSTGRFEDIVVEAAPRDDGVALIFRTKPAWFVGRVTVTGVPGIGSSPFAESAQNSLTNHLLIAMPSLSDPNFAQTVTCICEHNADGAMGIVVNRLHEGLFAKDIFEELAIACSTFSSYCMNIEDAEGTAYWGGRALELAERLEDTTTLVHVLNNLGTMEALQEKPGGVEKLARSVELAQRALWS